MFNRDRWTEILEALNANRFRTFLTAFGVAWGIFILVALLALINGLRAGVSKDFGDFATNSMYVWTQQTSMPYKGLPKGRGFRFKLEDIQVLKDNFPQLTYVSPRNQLGGYQGSNNVTRNARTGAFTINGDYPDFIKQQPMDITQGRFISYSDIEEKRKAIVIGVDVVKSLYDKDEEVIGTYIKINGVNFMVVGVFQATNSDGNSEEEANSIFVPFTTFGQVFNYADNVNYMVATAEDETSITDLKPQILAKLREQRTVHPDDERALGNFDRAEAFGKVTGLFDILSFVGFFVGFLILASGMIGIINIMLIVVKERTKEIGVRRAIGASPWDIRSQIMQESLVLTIISGMCGVAGAAGLIWAMNYALDQSGPVDNFANPTVNIGIVLIALLILIIAGILAGLIPAMKATKMKPVDALRIE